MSEYDRAAGRILTDHPVRKLKEEDDDIEVGASRMSLKDPVCDMCHGRGGGPDTAAIIYAHYSTSPVKEMLTSTMLRCDVVD